MSKKTHGLARSVLRMLSGAAIGGAFVPHALLAEPLDSQGIETIVVTAQRRSEDIQKIGAAVVALGSKQLDAARVAQPVDLMNVTPGLSSVNMTSDGTPVFAIRGVGMDDFNPNNGGGTAVYLDNVYQSLPMFLSGQLFDLERVEVLKGPQATLYGRNATGGAINFISREPGQETEGSLKAGYARWNEVSLSGAIGGALSAEWSGRLAGTYVKQTDGWQEDIDTGRKFGKTDRQAVRAMLKYAGSGRLTALVSLRASADDSLPSSPQSSGNGAYIGEQYAPQLDTGTTDPSKVRVGDLDVGRNESGFGGTVSLNYTFEPATFSAYLAVDRYSREVADSYDGIAGPTFDFLQDEDARQYYAELRLVSNERLFADRVDWVAGISFARSHLDGNDSSDQSAPFVGAYGDPADFLTTGLSVAQARYEQDFESWGVFLQTTTRLTAALRLVLGGRYAHDSTRFDGVSLETGSADGGVLFQGIGAVVSQMDQNVSDDSVSYRVGLEYDLSDWALLYANASSASKAGTFYASPALDPAAWRYVKPESISALEAGLKTNWYDGRLQLNVAAFSYDYSDRQSITVFISPVTGFPTGSLDNIPNSRIDGAELELVARPATWLTLTAGVSYLDARIEETLTDVGGAPLLGPLPKGSRLSQAPKNSYLFSTNVSLPSLAGWRPEFNVNGRWSGEQTTVVSDPNGWYGPVDVVSARLSAQSPTAAWDVAAWVDNLTDSRDTTYSATSFWGGYTDYRQKPRSYGVEVMRRFR